jgi:hypothetical protein
MTYPWSSGEVLTAADLNAYAGLVLVKTQTIGTTVASVTMTDAFSSTFDNYRIVVTGVDCSVGGDVVSMILGASTTLYDFGGQYTIYSTNNGSFFGGAAQSKWDVMYQSTDANSTMIMDIFGPYLSQATTMTSISTGQNVTRQQQGSHNVASSYGSFTLTTFSGTMTGGTIRVYGYNNG